MLVFLRKLTLHPSELDATDVDAVRAAGVSDEAIRDAITACAMFNVIDRIADALDFTVLSQDEFDLTGRIIYDVGYAMMS